MCQFSEQLKTLMADEKSVQTKWWFSVSAAINCFKQRAEQKMGAALSVCHPLIKWNNPLEQHHVCH
jgi:hypothetical protein